jgi:hypothetical protein
MNMTIRDVPDHVRAILVGRAEARGLSLRAYVVEVLSDHVALPTVSEWLAEVESLPPTADTDTAASALAAERDTRDTPLAHTSPPRAGRRAT